MNDFGAQLLIALALICVIGVPTILYKLKKYIKEGKSIKYLELKVMITVAIPIFSILLLLRKELSFIDKIFILLVALIGMIAYAYSITSARKSFREMTGLPPEDENTGEVIKEEKEKEEKGGVRS